MTLPVFWSAIPPLGYDIFLEFPVFWPISANVTLQNCPDSNGVVFESCTSILNHAQRKSYLHIRVKSVTAQNHNLSFEVGYPLASIKGFFSATDPDYHVRGRIVYDGRFLHSFNYRNLSQFLLDPVEASYADFTCHTKEDLLNTSFFNRRQNNFPIEGQRTIYTLGFQLPNTLPEGVMDPGMADDTHRRAIGAYIKIRVEGYTVINSGLYYSSHNSFLRGELQKDVNDCVAPCDQHVGFYAFDELLKEKLIQFRLELLNPAYTGSNVNNKVSVEVQYRKGTKVLGVVYQKTDLLVSSADCEVQPSAFVPPALDPIVEAVFHSTPTWKSQMGSFSIDLVPRNKRAGTEVDVFEVSVPDAFKLVDGQYVLRLDGSANYKANTITQDGSGNNVLRFEMDDSKSFPSDSKVNLYLTSVNGSNSRNGFVFPDTIGEYSIRVVHRVETTANVLVTEEWNQVVVQVKAPPLVYFEPLSLVKNADFDVPVTFQFVCSEELSSDHLLYFELPLEFDDVFLFDNATPANQKVDIFSDSLGQTCKTF